MSLPLNRCMRCTSNIQYKKAIKPLMGEEMPWFLLRFFTRHLRISNINILSTSYFFLGTPLYAAYFYSMSSNYTFLPNQSHTPAACFKSQFPNKYRMMCQSNTTNLYYVYYCIRATCFDSYRIIFRPF